MMRRVDDELAGHADRFRGLVEVCNDLMQCVDARGIVEYVNPAWLRTLGRAEAEVVGRPITEFLHADAIAHCREVLADVFAGRPRHGVEVAFCGADGSKVVVEGDVLPRQVDGEVVATQAFFRDVTRQRAIAADRTAKMAFLDQVVESAPEALVFLANDGRVTRVNPEFTRLFGYTDAEARGWPIDELVVPEAMRAEGADLCRRAAAAETVNIETVRQRKDGALVEVSLLATPIRAGGEQLAILGIYRDVSERRRLQARLERAQRMEAVGRLAGGIAHDFNNLLTVIQAAADHLLTQAGADPTQRADAEEVLAAADKAAALTRQLIAFSRKQVLQPVALDVGRVVGDIGRMLGRVIGERIALTLDVAPGLRPALADPAQVEQVLMNLALNARDAMPHGGQLRIGARDVELAGAAAVALGVDPGSYVELLVADTGCGIPPATIERIFEPFWSTKAADGRGAGLGLSTVYGIVQQSRGAVAVHSEVDIGTRFHVYLPCARALPAAAAAAPPPQASRGAGSILVVEDDDSIRWLVERALRHAGHRVHVAANAAAAVALAERLDDLVLVFTDVVMPGGNGPELVARLRSRRPSLRVLFSSGYADDRAFESALLPDTHFLAKPYSIAALAAKVRAVLDA
ncbi:MAG: PAS domain S-box protein [Planctomycetota bacterium]